MPNLTAVLRLPDCPSCGAALRVLPPSDPGKVSVKCSCGRLYSIDFYPNTPLMDGSPQQRIISKEDDFGEIECLNCFHLFQRHDGSTKECEVEGCGCEGFKPIK